MVYRIFLSKLAGDIAEVNVIINVFKASPEIKRNGTKARNLKPTPHKVQFNHRFLFFHSLTGRCLGAAGGLEAIATIKAITTGWLHPTINQDVILIISPLISFSHSCACF